MEKIKDLSSLKGRALIKALLQDEVDDSVKEKAVATGMSVIDRLGKAIDDAKQLEKDFNELAEEYNKLKESGSAEVPTSTTQIEQYEKAIEGLKVDIVKAKEKEELYLEKVQLKEKIYKEKIQLLEMAEASHLATIKELEANTSTGSCEDSFLKCIHEFSEDGLSIHFTTKKIDNSLTLSIIPIIPVKDEGFKSALTPMSVTGTPDEISANAKSIFEGMSSVKSAFKKIAEYEKNVENALAESEMKKKESEEKKKAKEEAGKQIEKIIKSMDGVTDKAILSKKWGEILKLDPQNKEALEYIESSKSETLF